MDYYKIRLKLAKNILPKFKDEEVQWDAVKKLVKNGHGEIALLEKSESEFARPEGLQQFSEWNKKFTSDLFLEFSVLLSEETAGNISEISNVLFRDLEKCNMVDYSYQLENGRFESWAYFDNSEFEEVEFMDISEISPEEKEPAKQIDMFKKKGKGKSK